MNRLTQKIGQISSLIAALSFIIFTVCFVAIALAQDIVTWTNIEDYLAGIKNNDQVYKHIAQICSITFGLSYLVIMNCLSEVASAKRQILQKLSMSFGVIFTALITINYFLQITAVQFILQQGFTDGIANWIMFNPNSISLSIAMLGWTIMLGLSSLFAAPIFEGKGLSRTIRVLFFLSGFFCIFGGIGFVKEWVVLVNLTINMGMGGTMTLLMIFLSRYFWLEGITYHHKH